MNGLKNFLRQNCSIREGLRYFLLILFVSIAVSKVMLDLHDGNLSFLSQAANSVLTGTPAFIAFQNRLLGPWIVHLISEMGYPLADSFARYIIFMIIIQNVVMFSLLRKMRVSYVRSLQYVILFSLLFICAQCTWFYPWDSLDLLIFTLFSFAIFQELSVVYFFWIFVFALLNRESALFISAYIVIDSFKYSFDITKWLPAIKISLVSRLKLAIGIILTFAGVAYVKIIRQSLFVVPPDLDNYGREVAMGNHLNFFNNMEILFHRNLTTIDMVNTMFILASLGYILLKLRHCTNVRIKASLVFFIMFASVLVFGQINETRTYFILLPLLVFFQVYEGISPTERGSSCI